MKTTRHEPPGRARAIDTIDTIDTIAGLDSVSQRIVHMIRILCERTIITIECSGRFESWVVQPSRCTHRGRPHHGSSKGGDARAVKPAAPASPECEVGRTYRICTKEATIKARVRTTRNQSAIWIQVLYRPNRISVCFDQSGVSTVKR